MGFQSEDEGARIAEAMASLKPIHYSACIEERWEPNRPPLVRTLEIAALFDHAKQIAEMDYDLKEGSVGGGSDGNFIPTMGVPVLDGLGVDGAGVHAEHEHIIIEDIPRRAALLAAVD